MPDGEGFVEKNKGGAGDREHRPEGDLFEMQRSRQVPPRSWHLSKDLKEVRE